MPPLEEPPPARILHITDPYLRNLRRLREQSQHFNTDVPRHRSSQLVPSCDQFHDTFSFLRMKDPFFVPPIPWLSELVQPWSDRLNLPSLPRHIHEVVLSALFYTLIFWPVSPMLSRLLAPQHYNKLSRKRRLNWDAHVVSFIQSTLINVVAIWVMVVDEERKNMDWEERVWGYTGAAGMVQALAAGYFVWDLFVTSLNLDVFGLGTLAHAIAALLVYTLGFVRWISPEMVTRFFFC